MDLCSVELVQVEGMSMTEAAASPPTTNEDNSTNVLSRLNMYMLIFTRPGHCERTVETNELFNSICDTAMIGLP